MCRLDHKTFIINNPTDIARLPLINTLKQYIPDCTIYRAIVPAWEQDRAARAVRGCTLSHLDIAVTHTTATDAVLVLEDDAVIHEEHIDQWNKIKDKIPSDAGIILLGTETEKLGPPDQNGFMQVLPINWGTHGVLYLPSLTRTKFFNTALFIAALYRLGPVEHANIGLCYESILHMALGASGLKAYRPPAMLFSTAPTISNRSAAVEPGRTKNLVIPVH